MGEDLEKPKPEFTVQADAVIAKLIPRGKNSSVALRFEAPCGGKLAEVESLDFQKIPLQKEDPKSFRSGLFAVYIEELEPGSEGCVSLASSFFSSSTRFRVYKEHGDASWTDPGAENIAMGDTVQNLVITVTDGGTADSDGIVNGKIILIGGPWDSFWGYVLGTLIIRFFGVFIVLGVLMAGMIVSGLVFQKMTRKAREMPSPLEADPDSGNESGQMGPEMAAAVGLAISLHLSEAKSIFLKKGGSSFSVWAHSGREQIMSDRSMVYNRIKK